MGAEELEHSCQIKNRNIFSFGAKIMCTFHTGLGVHVFHAEHCCMDIPQIRASFSYRTGVKRL